MTFDSLSLVVVYTYPETIQSPLVSTSFRVIRVTVLQLRPRKSPHECHIVLSIERKSEKNEEKKEKTEPTHGTVQRHAPIFAVPLAEPLRRRARN